MIIARFMNTCEGIFSVGQARFKTGCITDEQIAQVRIINEKYKNHHIRGLICRRTISLYIKKKFDRVWRDALWVLMKKLTLEENWSM